MKSVPLFSALGLSLLLTACQTVPDGARAQAALQAKSGSQVAGNVTLSQEGTQLVVTASFSGLKPNAEHGFHIHEKGDCSSADGMSAGGHFNPGKTAHGHAHGGAHHAGDMPNIRTGSDGRADYRAVLDGVSLEGAQGALGRAVIVHRDPDDYRSQPAGNAGARIACGLIQR